MEMKFPSNYFVSFIQPAKVYQWRKQYSWPKLILLVVFTIAFTFVPISFIFLNMNSFNLDMFIPTTMSLVTDDTVRALESCDFSDARLTCESTEIVTATGVFAIAPTSEYTISGEENAIQVAEASNAILFLEDRVVLTDENGVGFSVQYPLGVEKLAVTSVEDVKTGIGELWYSQYRPVAVPVLIGAVLIMLFATIGIYLGFIGLILYMMKFSRMVEIDSYKEAFAMVVVATGLPTLLGVGIAFFTQDIAVLLTIQSFGMIVILLISYFLTRFRMPVAITADVYEEKLREKKQK
ncbi:MAG: DUF1189 family protein [Culicoidibacterales bacterium]